MTKAIAFDFTINLTTILGVIVWMVTLAIAWSKFGGRIDMLELRVTHMEQVLDKIATTLTLLQSNEKQIIVLNEQLATMQREHSTLHQTVEQLRRGDGWISGTRRTNVDGEYPNQFDPSRRT